MNALKKTAAVTLLLSTAIYVNAQIPDDMLRLTAQNVQGTARFSGMGGAFNALGGDFGSLSTNPAGIGIYRGSELSLTPSLSINQYVTDYLGTSENDSRTRAGVSNFGYIGTWIRPDRTKGLISFNLGLGYNKISDFNAYSSLKGYYTDNSKIPNYTALANNNFSNTAFDFIMNNNDDNVYGSNEFYPDEWTTAGAIATYLVNYDQEGDFFYPEFDNSVEKLNHFRKSSSKGSSGEYLLSFGGNVSNRFFFGATLGAQDINYRNIVDYSEHNVTETPVTNFGNFTQIEYFSTVGTGFNLKLGIIVKPVDMLRIGLAFHSPTWYELTDRYAFDMISESVDVGRAETYSIENIYDYRMMSPYRFEAGIACVFGKYGLVSVDYEYTANNAMKYFDDYNVSFADMINNRIKDSYKGSSTVRAGAELNLGGGLMIRGGFNYIQSPYKDVGSNYDFSRYVYAGGLGYRSAGFFVDIAYSANVGNYCYVPYFIDDLRVRNTDFGADAAKEKQILGTLLLTLGIKF